MAVECWSKSSFYPFSTFPVTPINNYQLTHLFKIKFWQLAYLSIHHLPQLLFAPLLQPIRIFPFTFQSPLFLSLSPSIQFSLLLYFLLQVFTPLTFLFPSTFAILWLLFPHEKGGSVLLVLPRVRVLLGLLRVNRKGLRST